MRERGQCETKQGRKHRFCFQPLRPHLILNFNKLNPHLPHCTRELHLQTFVHLSKVDVHSVTRTKIYLSSRKSPTANLLLTIGLLTGSRINLRKLDFVSNSLIIQN